MLSDVEEELTAQIARLRAELARERRARAARMTVNRLGAETSSEITRLGVSQVIADGARDVFDSHWAIVAFVEGDLIRFAHGAGVPEEIVADWSTAPLDAAIPAAAVLRREAERCVLTNPADFVDWPILESEAKRAEIDSLHVESIAGDDGSLGVIMLGWRDPHELDARERELLDEMVETAAPALVRARATETAADVADTLQGWLLPGRVPDVGGLEIATMFEPGRDEMQVGGDWYDVVVGDEGTTSLVVGDVIGHDARAAAEMGQFRHVLASQLLATGDAVASFELTDAYFSGRGPDTMATALVIVHHQLTGTIEVASAGHPAPLVLRPGEPARSVEIGLGPPLGSGLGGYGSITRTLPNEAVLVAFTDGVVEERGTTIDVGIDRLRRDLDRVMRASDRRGDGEREGGRVQPIAQWLRERVLGSASTDDAAAIVVRAAHDRPDDQRVHPNG